MEKAQESMLPTGLPRLVKDIINNNNPLGLCEVAFTTPGGHSLQKPLFADTLLVL